MSYFYKSLLFSANCVSASIKGIITNAGGQQNEMILLAKGTAFGVYHVKNDMLIEDFKIELLSEILLLLNVPRNNSDITDHFFVLTSSFNYMFFTISDKQIIPKYCQSILKVNDLRPKLLTVSYCSQNSLSFIAILFNDCLIKIFPYKFVGNNIQVSKPFDVFFSDTKPVIDFLLIQDHFLDENHPIFCILHGGQDKPYQLKTFRVKVIEQIKENTSYYSDLNFMHPIHEFSNPHDKYLRLMSLNKHLGILGINSFRLYNPEEPSEPVGFSIFPESDFNIIYPLNLHSILLGCRKSGCLYYLCINGKIVKSTIVGEIGPLSCICQIKDNLMFLGSETDNSKLVYLTFGQRTQSEELPFMRIVQTYPNFGPMFFIDHVPINSKDNRNKQFLISCPLRHSSQLIAFNKWLEVKKLFSSYMKGLQGVCLLPQNNLLAVTTFKSTIFIQLQDGMTKMKTNNKWKLPSKSLLNYEHGHGIVFAFTTQQIYKITNTLNDNLEISLHSNSYHIYKTTVIVDAKYETNCKKIFLLNQNSNIIILDQDLQLMHIIDSFPVEKFTIDQNGNIFLSEWFHLSIKIVTCPGYNIQSTISYTNTNGICDIKNCEFGGKTQLLIGFNDGSLNIITINPLNFSIIKNFEINVGYLPFQISFLEIKQDKITILAGYNVPQMITWYDDERNITTVGVKIDGLRNALLLNSHQNTYIAYATKNELIFSYYSNEYQSLYSFKEIHRENKLVKAFHTLSKFDQLILCGQENRSQNIFKKVSDEGFISVIDTINLKDVTTITIPNIIFTTIYCHEKPDKLIVFVGGVSPQPKSHIQQQKHNELYMYVYGENILTKQENIEIDDEILKICALTEDVIFLLVGYGVFKFYLIKETYDRLYLQELFTCKTGAFLMDIKVWKPNKIIGAEYHKSLILWDVVLQGKKMIQRSKTINNNGFALSCFSMGNYMALADFESIFTIYEHEPSGKADKNFITLKKIADINLHTKVLGGCAIQTKKPNSSSFSSKALRKIFKNSPEQDLVLGSHTGDLILIRQLNPKLFKYLSCIQIKIIEVLMKKLPIYSSLGKNKVTKIPIDLIQNPQQQQFFLMIANKKKIGGAK